MTFQESNTKIIELLSQGKTYKEIAAELDMKPRTVLDRVQEMKRRNECVSRDQLLVKWLQNMLKLSL